MYNILWMEYLPAFGHLVTNHQNQDSPPFGEEVSTPEDRGVLLPRILRISPVEEGMDQKVCYFPQAYALAARCVCSAMKASFPVCPSTSVWSAHWQTRKATKQNSCPWQYKIGSPGATTVSFAWREAPLPSSGVLPSRQSIGCVYILAHLLRRCTRLLNVLPSRQQSAI